MNERIKELVEQATTIDEVWGRGFDLPEYTERFDKEKFAELIVKECTNQIADDMIYLLDTIGDDDYDKGYRAGLYRAVDVINKTLKSSNE